MRRVKIFLVAMTVSFAGAAAYSQTNESILNFIGTSDAEELSPHDVERLEDLLSHPLRINQISGSALEKSGLLTHYQAASLTDYRARHGDVLSLTELASVDGFGSEFVSRIGPFISLESRRLPGESPLPSVRNDISMRIGWRSGSALTYGMKYRMSAGERLSAGVSVSRTSDASDISPDAFAGYMAFHFKRQYGTIVIGDFNARFGQGLALWNGMSFSGLTSASSFMRKPTGISLSSSFTGGYSLRGAAMDMSFGRVRMSVLAAVSRDKRGTSVMPAFNLSWFMRNGQLSFTHYADFSMSESGMRIPDMKTSADMAFCLKGKDLYAEISYDWVSASLAGIGGFSFRAGEDAVMSAMLRFYPSSYSPARSAAARSTTKCSNEYAASLAADFSAGEWVRQRGMTGFGSSVKKHVGRVSFDLAYYPLPKGDAAFKSIQIKAQGEYSAMITDAFKVSVRVSERVRTWGDPFRTDLRTDLSYVSRRILANLRLNVLKCSGYGLLGYAEAGYKGEKFSLYLRQGIFRVDRWADRIYVYERDAPGSFNVPAYYGRGVWTALSMNWKFARRGRMYVRGAVASYPFMTEKKPGRAELKFQFVFTF